MQSEGCVFVRVYLGAFAIIFSTIAIVLLLILWHTENINQEVKQLRLILQNDYEYEYTSPQQENGNSPRAQETQARKED